MPRWPTRTPEERLARTRERRREEGFRYRLKHHEEKLARDRAYHHANRNSLLPKMRTSYRTRRAEMTPKELVEYLAKHNEAEKRYYATNTEAILTKAKTPHRRAQAAAYQRAKREADPEGMRAYQRSWGAANPEKSVAKTMRWAKKNPDKVRANISRRRARKQSAPRNDVTVEQERAVIAAAHGVCPYCPHYNPGCQACKKGTHKLTIDHITALVNGGPHTLHNLIACCRSCNCKKRTRNAPVPVQPLLL